MTDSDGRGPGGRLAGGPHRRPRRAPVLVVVILAGAGLAAVGVAWSIGSPAPTRHVRLGMTTDTPPATTSSSATAPVPASSTAPSATAPSSAAPIGSHYAVAGATVTLVDPTRPTPARGGVTGSSERVLRTVVRRPVGAPGRLPLVVFGPGFDATPETYEVLLDAWAAAGYLVAAPDFPGSGSDLAGPPTENDIAQQARDLSFVVTSMLGGGQGPVDPARIAVAGHSDGASSVVVLAENPAYSDQRIAAYVVLAGQIPDGVAGPWDAAPAGALLCVVGTDDQYGNLSLTGSAYRQAAMTKAMVTVPGGDHATIFTGTGAVPDQVRAATIRFLATSLGAPRPVTDAALSAALAPPAGVPPYEFTTG